MSKSNLIMGRDLGQAICQHFGIDYHKHTVDSNFEIKTAPGELVSVKLTFMLRADDLAGIARAAGADGVQTFTASGDFCKPNKAATVAVDAETSETLRCYGARGERSEIAALTEEVRQLRKELNKSLYEVAKNTKRSAYLAEEAVASAGANAVTVLKD